MTGEEARERAAALVARGEALRSCPVADIAAALAATNRRFADPGDPARREAVSALAAHHGAPEAAIERILDAAFPRWGAGAIERWIRADLGDPAVLDRFVEVEGVARAACGPRLVLSIQARGVPTTPVADLMAALLVKAPTWLKPASGADDLAARYAEALAEVDPLVAEAVAVESFSPGSDTARAVTGAADLVVATGGRETMEAIRREAASGARVVLHGPRLSAAAIGRAALEADPDGAIGALAADVALAGQTGCLSPVVAWVEAPAAEVHALAGPVLDACRARWPGRPRSEAGAAERAAWAEWTALASVEAAAGTGGPTAGGADAGWTIRTRSRADAPDPPPVARALMLEPVESLEDVAALCSRRRGLVASVGLAAPRDRIETLAPALARAGVERVVRLGSMQRPTLGWRRDGRPELADLVRWTEREG